MTIRSLTGTQAICISFGICLIAIPSSTFVSAAADPPKPQFAVAPDPDGQVTELKYDLDKPDLVAQFFVRNLSDVEAKGLRLTAHLEETNQIRGATVLKLSSDGNRLDDGSLTLAQKGSVAIELKVTGLPRGQRRGYLLIDHAGNQSKLAPLTFTYNVEPLVKVVGLAEGATLQGTTFKRDYEHVISIQSQNDTPIQKLNATVTGVSGPDGIQRSATIQLANSGPMPASLDAHAIVNLVFRTELPLAGIYTATIVVAYDAHTREIPISITRAKMLLPYEILAPDAIRENIAWGGTDARIRITLHELNGMKLTQQQLPELTSLNSVFAGTKPYQIPIVGTKCTDDAHKVLTTIDLAPGESRAVWLTIIGLRSAGEHAGTLRLSLPDGQTVSQVVSVIARLDVSFAVFCIAFGIVLSQILKMLGAASRNIQEQQQLSKIDQNAERLSLTPEMTPDGRAILKQLRARLSIIFAESQSNRGQSYVPQITELDRKIRMTPLWVAASKAIQSIRQPVPDLLAALDDLKHFLLAENTNKDELDQHEKQLEKLKTDTEAKIRSLLSDAITTLRNQLNLYQQLDWTPHGSAERIDQVFSLVEAARVALSKSAVELAQQKYDEATVEFVKALIDDLSEIVRQPPNVLPAESVTEGWKAVRDRLDNQISRCTSLLHNDPNSALQLVWRVRATYWSESLRLAINWIISNVADPNESQKRILANLQKFASQFDELLAARDVQPESVLEIERRIQLLGPQNAQMRRDIVGVAEAASSPLNLLSYLPEIRLFPSNGMESIRLNDTTSLAWIRWINEFLILFLSGVVAVLLGLKLLWIDNLVWGTCNDRLIAVLWGLGLHQVANASFDFTAQIARLTKPSVAPE